MSSSKKSKESFEDLSSELDDAFSALFGDETEDMIGLAGGKNFPEYYAGEDTIIMKPDGLSKCGVLDEDDILELTDTINSSEKGGARIQVDDFEEIIDLIEKVAPAGQATENELSEAGLLDDDDIIELTDIVSLPEDESEAISQDDFEAIINLIEKVAPVEHTLVGEDTLGSLSAMIPESFDFETEEDSVILLTDVLEKLHPNADKAQMDKDSAMSPKKTDTRPGFPEDAIEAAVERYILKKYGSMIEAMIARTIEQTVIHEMENLKQHVLEDEAG